MAASKTVICNMALEHLGVSVEISDIETERSAEARACRRFYETSLKATLRDFPWPFAIKFTTLGLIEESPNNEWDFSYQLPSDCLKTIKILSGTRNDRRSTRVPFEISNGDNGTIILTDAEDAQLKYVSYVSDTNRFSPDFDIAFSWRLAVYIAPKLTSGDPFKLKDNAMRMYMSELSTARANALNEEQPEQDADGELVASRE